MNACYLCNDPFTDQNKSYEHIILNAIGGHLKANDLLCKACNSDFGGNADAELARQLTFLSSFLQVKRESGTHQPIRDGKAKDGKEYELVDGIKPVASKPRFEKTEKDGKVNISITARSEKEMLQMLQGLKDKFPQFDIEAAKRSLQWQEYYMDEPLTFNTTIGGELAFRSLLKTAVNYYIHTQKEKSSVEHLFDYLKGVQEFKNAKHYHPKKPIYKKEPGEIIHLIHLVGNKGSKLLYCFIELFSSYSFLIVLSENYTGKNIQSTYAYDVLQSKVVDKKVALKLRPTDIKILEELAVDDFKIITEKLDRVMKIGHKLQVDREISRISSAAVDKVFQKHKGETVFTEQMVTELSNEISTAYVRFAFRGEQKKRLN
jgi:hypothetical protein